ncbi:MAG TPA: cysteine desulfurase family protein [Candidatus Magasanikbacteria bacterium]|nr:cysteine desulfurase family protein [Candidatus Magasanikbacteria bacterium]
MMKKKTSIYLDYAAATPVDSHVFVLMKPYFSESFTNPSSLYESSKKLAETYAECKKQVADFFHTTPDTITYVSGGSESVNTAIMGIARSHGKHGRHIITTRIEHSAVLESVRTLETYGYDVTYLPVDEYGLVSVKDVIKAIRKDTILISIMHANNEIGSIQPIEEIGREILKYRKKEKTIYPLFHVDACQSVLYLESSVEKLHVDALSCNGGKIYGPKSSGILYVRRGVELEPLIVGGGQQDNKRSGTIDMAMVVGMTEAIKLISNNSEDQRIKELRDRLWNGIKRNIFSAVLNGPEINDDQRLPNNLNVSFVGAHGEALVLYLDAQGICVSTGSACAEDSRAGSHVLEACGYDAHRKNSAIRFTLGKHTTEKEIDTVLEVLPDIVAKVRNMNS